ncbi:MAG: hypothetical protein ACM3U1_04275 [Chloroflexota bacterium]
MTAFVRAFLFSIIPIALLVDYSAASEDWEVFICEEGGFSALYPGAPTAEDVTDDYKGIKSSYRSFSYSSPQGEDYNAIYVTQYMIIARNDQKLAAGKSSRNFLRSKGEEFLKRFKGKVSAESFINHNGLLGFEIGGVFDKGSVLVKSRYFLVGDKLLVAQVYTSPEYDDNENMARFFNSFTILENKRPSENEADYVDQRWKRFTCKEGGFSALMPATPKKTANKTSVKGIPLEYYTYTCKPESENEENIAYQTTYYDRPFTYNYSDPSLTEFNEFVDGFNRSFLKTCDGRIISEEQINYNDYPGRGEVIKDGKGTMVINIRFYMVNARLFILMTATGINNYPNASIDKFFDSFTLLENAESE